MGVCPVTRTPAPSRSTTPSGRSYDPEVNEQLGVTYDPTQWPLHLDGELVTADILITVYGEPIDVIRRTADAAKAVRGAHDTYILDDGRSDDVRDLAAELGARLHPRGCRATAPRRATSTTRCR